MPVNDYCNAVRALRSEKGIVSLQEMKHVKSLAGHTGYNPIVQSPLHFPTTRDGTMKVYPIG